MSRIIREQLTLLSVSLVFASILAVIFAHPVAKKPVAEKQSVEIQFAKTTEFAFQQNEARYLAFQLLERKQFACFDYIITHESHWRANAKNKKSTATGVGQLLAKTYKNIGLKHSDDPRAQMIASLAYISRWYGSGGPCAAKRHWVKLGWY